MYGSEPTYSPYTQSPSPAAYGNPVTPGGSIPPVSPAYNPHTPGAGLEEPGPGDWVTTDIEVRINMNHEVSSLVVVGRFAGRPVGRLDERSVDD